MDTKTVVLFASALFVQSISCQCIGSLDNINTPADVALNPLAYNSMGAVPSMAYPGQSYPGQSYPGQSYPGQSYPGLGFTPSSGGTFTITSSSPIAPTGIRVFSENGIEGSLDVNGQLPFLGTIVIEGALPTAGTGSINYGCGSTNVGIVSEGATPAALGLGYGPGFAGPGLSLGPMAYNGLMAGRPCGAVF